MLHSSTPERDGGSVLTFLRRAGAAATPPAVPRPLLGRERELSELRAGLEDALAGRGGLVLVEGEAGIGKTRLADALSDHAREAGARVVWGRCWEGGGGAAYWPWTQVIRALPGEAPPDLGSLVASGARFAVFDAAATFLVAAARETPLVVVLDDVHAADHASLVFLRFLAGSLRDAAILVLATLRESEARRDPGVARAVADLRRDAGAIRLRGLDVDGVQRLIEARTGSPGTRAFARRVHAITDGNPFFVDEIVRLGRPTGTGTRMELEVPAGVREAIGRRLEPLPAEARQVLSLAAVAGREFSAGHVAQAGGVPLPVVLEALEAARALELVDHCPGEAFRFSHELVREALYESLTPARRMELHARLAELLEVLPGAEDRVAELAHHFAESRSPEALEYARRAGDRAIALLAYEEAAVHYGRALDLEDDPGERCDLLLALGGAEMSAGETETAHDAFRRAAAEATAIGSGVRLARAALGRGSGSSSWADGTVDAELVGLLEQALEALGDADPALRSRLLSRLAEALLFAYDCERTRALSAEALALAREAGDPHALGLALGARQLAIRQPSTREERGALAAEMLALAESEGDRELEMWACAWRVRYLLEHGDMRAAEDMMSRARAVAEHFRTPDMLWTCASWDAMRALLDAHMDEADRLCHEALAAGEGAVAPAPGAYAIQLMAVRLEQARFGEVEPAVAAIALRYPAVRAWRCAHIALLAALGRDEEARAELERLPAGDVGVPFGSQDWLPSAALIAQASHKVGDAERAEALYRQLLPFAGHNVVFALSVCCMGSVASLLGLLATTLGRFDAADRHFEDALGMHLRMGSRVFVAHTRCEWAAMLLERGVPGDAERSSELLRAAISTARELGLAQVEARASELMSGIAQAGRTTQPGPASRALLAREGDYWTVGFAGAPVRLRHSKGLAYLAELLRRPGADVHVLELAGSTATASFGDAGAVLDEEAKRAYRERLQDLRAELDQAEAWSDPERAARARGEIEALEEALVAALGVGGRDRRPGTAAERARSSVTKAIRTAIRRIAEHDPALGEHLELTVRTGYLCAYRPEARSPVDWHFTS